MTSLTVIRPGMLTTVQDLGRWGYQIDGVPVAGPMDHYSHRLANQLAGNDDAAAALEITWMGPELEASGDVVCVIAGGEFGIAAGSRPVPMNAPFTLESGARLRFFERRTGARATLAVRGGFDVPPVFGSRATSVIGRMGPFGGRPLVAGDVLPVGTPAHEIGRSGSAVYSTRVPIGGARIRAIPGPHEHFFTAAAVDAFFSARFTLTPSSNRMGYRLNGPALAHASTADILSDATPIGSIQVPGAGQPILLMADRQTTGGYPKIATVITADLPAAGQLAPGDWIEFVPCTRGAAIDALKEQERRLTGRTR